MTAAAMSARDVTRRIGLSLGADLCWPVAYRAILDRLNPRIPSSDGTIRFQLEDVTIEPFDLQQGGRYDVVIDRLTHWYFPTREWIKKSVIMDGLYVFNNPWSVQSMEKHSTYCAMMRLGLPVPRTWLLPPKSYDPQDDLAVTLKRYARLFDLPAVARDLGYPVFMKPYDGGGWRGVSRIEDDELRPVPGAEREMELARRMARNTFNKTRRVNLRVTERDFNLAHSRAREEGIPYQTLLSSVIHKYLSGRLIEKR